MAEAIANTTTMSPLQMVTPMVDPVAGLMLLQLLTQLKPPKQPPCNGSSGGEEALRALVRDAVLGEEEMKRLLDIQERSLVVAKENFSAEIRNLTEKVEQCQTHNLELQASLSMKNNEIKKLQEKEAASKTELRKAIRGKRDYDQFLKAAKTGNIAGLTLILDTTYGNLEHQDSPGEWTALEWAVAHGHTEACRLLLERGASPQSIIIINIDELTFSIEEEQVQWPLRLAARFGQLEIASLLIQYGAEIPNDEPELMAKERGYLKLAQLLCEWKGKEKCLYLVETSSELVQL